MTSKYFGVPFANAGDKTTIPDASQPSGDVSFTDGYTPDYEKNQATDPEAKDVPRQSENYFKFSITEAMKEIQERGGKVYDPVVNYLVGGIIIGSDNNFYRCLIKNGPDSSFVPVVDPVGDATGTWVNHELSYPSVVSLKASLLTTLFDGQIVSILGYSTISENRDWRFRWNSSDLSTEVASDPQSGIYIALDGDPTGASGAFVRLFDGPVKAEWFGNLNNDLGLAVNNAVNAGFLHIMLPPGNYETLTEVNMNVENLVIEGSGIRATTITIKDDIVGFFARANYPTLRNFRLTQAFGGHSKNGIHIGEIANISERCIIDDVSVVAMGGHGVEIAYGALGNINNLHSISNGGDGLRFSGATNTRAYSLTGTLDLRGNGGTGLRVLEGSGNHVSGGLIVVQSNGAYGVNIDSDACIFDVYTEGNSSGGVTLGLTSSGNNFNFVNSQSSNPIADLGVGNMWNDPEGGANRRIFSNMYFQADKGFILRESAFVGNMQMKQIADNEWAIESQDSVIKGTFHFKHDSTEMNVKSTGYTGGKYLEIKDGMGEPDPTTANAAMFIDGADGDLKIKFNNGVVKTIVVDTP